MIEVTIRLKGSDETNQQIKMRHWKKLDITELKLAVTALPWEDLYCLTNLDVATHWLTSNLSKILNNLIPFSNIQLRRNHRKWVTTNTKEMMTDRDRSREKARLSQTAADWDIYRKQKN